MQLCSVQNRHQTIKITGKRSRPLPKLTFKIKSSRRRFSPSGGHWWYNHVMCKQMRSLIFNCAYHNIHLLDSSLVTLFFERTLYIERRIARNILRKLRLWYSPTFTQTVPICGNVFGVVKLSFFNSQPSDLWQNLWYKISELSSIENTWFTN